MLTQIYIEALLVDEELADQVWEAWDAGETDDLTALRPWWIVATQSETDRPLHPPNSGRRSGRVLRGR